MKFNGIDRTTIMETYYFILPCLMDNATDIFQTFLFALRWSEMKTDPVYLRIDLAGESFVRQWRRPVFWNIPKLPACIVFRHAADAIKRHSGQTAKNSQPQIFTNSRQKA